MARRKHSFSSMPPYGSHSFDVHSVVEALEGLTADAASVSLQWRAKQLEYSWLRSLMGRYVDFWTVTDRKRSEMRPRSAQVVAAILETYVHLTPYP